MGGCCDTENNKKPEVRNPILPYSKNESENPTVYKDCKFKFKDLTERVGKCTAFMQLKMRIHNYKPTDIRCMKDSRPHSFVVVTGSKLEQELEDSVLLIEYSDKGFKLTLGDLGFTPEDTFEASIQNVYLPKAEGKHNGGFQEIIDWTYEHKDEKYVDPTTTPELNMGKRVFNYVVSLVK